ncbi:hypothetical protein E2C01_024091 [Portunus trituberculatus]|uniref:Uncharacterized protein n=1 Tax=Portunus trituberculatus TaxID=210409 RepID=A0A5B7E9R4_PORTR|nr:hypothetical protein [Portunus trituberculatus]
MTKLAAAEKYQFENTNHCCCQDGADLCHSLREQRGGNITAPTASRAQDNPGTDRHAPAERETLAEGEDSRD